MIPLTLAEVAAAVDGRLTDVPDPYAAVTGTVEFDSRLVGRGGLFVALPGERVDGHDFAAAAVTAGAVGVLAARPLGVPAVVVPDVQQALGRLARAVLDRLPEVTVIGLTGSSGKTSTKDLLAHVLGLHGPTVAPPGSFNNEIGHPHTVLRAGPHTHYLVLECSARGPGHIAALCAIAPPTIGVVLNVGTAHLGEFGTPAAIAGSKAELVQALPADSGVAVLNADDPVVLAMAGQTAARVVTVGQGAGATVRAEDVRLDDSGRPSYTLHCPGGRAEVRLGLYGAHHVGNSLAAAAVALEVGLGVAEVAAALETARTASRWRMEVTDTDAGVRVVNDAYNANPESMAAALRALAVMATGRPGLAGRTGRTWAVLGEMAELGEHGPAAHVEIGRLAAELGVDRLVAVGQVAAALLDRSSGEWVPDVAAAVELLRREVRPGDVVLVKASRTVGLERVAQALLVSQHEAAV